MFNCLPMDIEFYIYKTYFSNFVICDLLNAHKKQYPYTCRKISLQKILDIPIKDKASEIINSLIDTNVVLDDSNIAQLDSMFECLVKLHKDGLFNIFKL